MAAVAVSGDRRDAAFLTKCLDAVWDGTPKELPKPVGPGERTSRRKVALHPQKPNWLAVLPACARGPLVDAHGNEKVQP